MKITASQVQQLRTMSGAGMMDCKKALVECEGDIDKAMEHEYEALQSQLQMHVKLHLKLS